MAGFARATAPASPSPAAALLTGERLVVFLFAARVALAAPVHLAAALAVLVAAALAVELAVDGSGSAPLRRFRTRCAGDSVMRKARCFVRHTSWRHYSAQRHAFSVNSTVKAPTS
ncbi:Dolichol kinase EVAN [Zea mays]|uniref:Dolichol kinase EVAN n=1 Tax=Zea mays TaxID=4577 RepID=A0A1D6H0S2_MAIZE|nr:Dolichol kinase EVAN [Zea mays]